MNWAQRIKQVFGIDIGSGAHCSGSVRIVASIQDPIPLRAILADFESHGALKEAHYRPAARGRRKPRGVPAAQGRRPAYATIG